MPDPHAGPSADAVVELLAATIRYMQDKITLEDWLEILARNTASDFAECARWVAGEPHQFLSSQFGSAAPFSTGWLNWAEHTMEQTAQTRPCFVDDGSSPKVSVLPARAKLNLTEVVVMPLDWAPARILLVLRKCGGDENWNRSARQFLTTVSPHIYESVQLHKQYDQLRQISDTTVSILDAAPRGILALSTDGSIRYANTIAEEIMSDGDGVSRKGNNIQFTDTELHNTFLERLKSVSCCPVDELPEHNWDLVIERPSERPFYQVVFRPTVVSHWNLESSASDRIANVYLHDPDKYLSPSFQQLKNFYNLTLAEAKLAIALFGGLNIADGAKQLGISVNTARTHLRNIFAKIGVKSQSELQNRLGSTLKYKNPSDQ